LNTIGTFVVYVCIEEIEKYFQNFLLFFNLKAIYKPKMKNEIEKGINEMNE